MLLLPGLLIGYNVNLNAAPGDKIVETAISHVTVYQNGAQVTRKAKIQLAAGESELTVRGLSPFLNEQSVQVKGMGNFTILSVSSAKDYMETLEESEKLSSLRQKLKTVTEKIADEEMLLGILKEEESFLISNKVIAGKDQTPDAGNFKSLYDFYSSGIRQVREGILEKNRSLSTLREEEKKLKEQIGQLQAGKDLPTGTITVMVKAPAATQAAFEINYSVANAGWYPSYDIRVDNPGEPARLVYKASVYQNTGIEWKNVMLSFSNATPERSGNVPNLFPWYINFIPENNSGVRPYVESAKKAVPAARQREAAPEAAELQELDMIETPTVGVQKENRTTSVEFSIDVPYTVESTGKPKNIDMMRISLPAKYEYQAIPRLSTDAFLVAGIHDWQNYDLLSGEAGIYFENTYVGKSMLDVQNVRDTMNISLGRDQGIVIKREKRKDFTSDQFIGGNRIETRSWEISLRNNKKLPIHIVVSDQVPISQNKDIVVETIELSGGKLNGKTGIIEWELDLKPGETKNLTLGYSVKYPKDKKIPL